MKRPTGPHTQQKWGGVGCWALEVWEEILTVNATIELGSAPMIKFENRVSDRANERSQLNEIQTGVDKSNEKLDENYAELVEVRERVEEAIRLMPKLGRLVSLSIQILGVIGAKNTVE